MDCTGERVIEDEYRKNAKTYLIYLFHLATYQFAVPYVRNKTVLDFGCGSGYGSRFLSRHCNHVTGIDISDEAVKFGNRNYKAANLQFKKIVPMEQNLLPFDDGTFEAVVSFQVVEHITDVTKYFNEIWRVLKDDGVFVLATPDRTTRLFRGQKPWNVFHLHEYKPEELQAIMLPKFNSIEMFGMSMRDDLMTDELKRTRRMKTLAYPFTFPGIPEPLRKLGLRLLKKIQALIPRTEPSKEMEFDFGVQDIYIAPQVKSSINIIVVAHKRIV